MTKISIHFIIFLVVLLDSSFLRFVGSHPWQAEIIVQQKQGKSSKMHLCSAVILSKKHILTSASCLTEYPIKKYRIVVAGKDKDTPEQEFTLQSIFTHDGYNEETGENNIALVKLKVKHRVLNYKR